jgi:hypothetical protein
MAKAAKVDPIEPVRHLRPQCRGTACFGIQESSIDLVEYAEEIHYQQQPSADTNHRAHKVLERIAFDRMPGPSQDCAKKQEVLQDRVIGKRGCLQPGINGHDCYKCDKQPFIEGPKGQP